MRLAFAVSQAVPSMETAQIKLHIRDLRERTGALRGYL